MEWESKIEGILKSKIRENLPNPGKSGKIRENLLNDLSNDLSDDLSHYLSNDLSNDSSNDLSNDLSNDWVMVMSTRSAAAQCFERFL